MGGMGPWMGCFQASEETPNGIPAFSLAPELLWASQRGLSLRLGLPGVLRPQHPVLRQLHIIDCCNPPWAGLFLPLGNEFLQFMGFMFLISELPVSVCCWTQ